MLCHLVVLYVGLIICFVLFCFVLFFLCVYGEKGLAAIKLKDASTDEDKVESPESQTGTKRSLRSKMA